MSKSIPLEQTGAMLSKEVYPKTETANPIKTFNRLHGWRKYSGGFVISWSDGSWIFSFVHSWSGHFHISPQSPFHHVLGSPARTSRRRWRRKDHKYLHQHYGRTVVLYRRERRKKTVKIFVSVNIVRSRNLHWWHLENTQRRGAILHQIWPEPELNPCPLALRSDNLNCRKLIEKSYLIWSE